MNPNASPLAALGAAETVLTGAVHAAADQLSQIGTSRLDAALGRLQTEAHAAHDRIARGMGVLHAVVADLVEAMTILAVETQDALSCNAFPALMAPTPSTPPAIPEPPPAIIPNVDIPTPTQAPRPGGSDVELTPDVAAPSQQRRRRKTA